MSPKLMYFMLLALHLPFTCVLMQWQTMETRLIQFLDVREEKQIQHPVGIFPPLAKKINLYIEFGNFCLRWKVSYWVGCS
jgi:hypothetical protein